MLGAVLAPALLWCAGLWLYSIRPLPPLPKTAGREISFTAAEFSHIPADGERCILANNVWNQKAAAQDSSRKSSRKT